ncbi:MAG: Rieske 2Fe-2S domain-containing protein [Candidatus Binatia bacterium]
MERTPVAVYERTIRASIERIWENVLDWEHLPWLHHTTFAHVHPLERGTDGWRAESALAWAPQDAFVIQVTLDRPRLRYVTRTVAGVGDGTEIETRLAPVGHEATRIAVEFRVPGVAPDQAGAVGDFYVGLYTRLWDEDEGMMVRRQAVVDGQVPAGCRTVEVGGRAIAFSTRCPHLGGPLDAAAIADGCVTCPWHGYRFDVRTGASADGRSLHLDPPSTR